MQIHTACEKSVSICRTSGAICGLTNHPAWHLCCSVRSVGDPKHPAWPFPIPHPKETLNIQHPTSHIINILLCNIRYTPVIFVESQK